MHPTKTKMSHFLYANVKDILRKKNLQSYFMCKHKRNYNDGMCIIFLRDNEWKQI